MSVSLIDSGSLARDVSIINTLPLVAGEINEKLMKSSFMANYVTEHFRYVPARIMNIYTTVC